MAETATDMTMRFDMRLPPFATTSFADQYRARGLEKLDDVSVFSWNAIREQGTAASGFNAGRVDQILQADGNAVQWTTPVACANLRFRRACLSDGAVVHDGDEGIDCRIEPLDAVETRGREFDRRDLFAMQQVGGVCNH